MLFFTALLTTAFIGLFEWNSKKMLPNYRQRMIVKMMVYGFVTILGIAILLRISLDSVFSTFLLSPFVAFALWRLIDLSYLYGKTKLTLSTVVLCIFLGTLLCLPLLSLNLQQQFLIEYLLDLEQPVPPADSIHPEAQRVVNV